MLKASRKIKFEGVECKSQKKQKDCRWRNVARASGIEYIQRKEIKKYTPRQMEKKRNEFR